MPTLCRVLPGMLTVVLCAAGADALLAQTAPEGHWDGALHLQARDVSIALDMAKNAKGEWIASFGIPEQRLTGVEIANINVDGKSVGFEVAGLPGKPEFTCKIVEAARMNCDIASPNGSTNADLKRTGTASVEAPGPSPAVSKEFEGDWAGAIELPNRTVQVTLHLINQPDKTVKATLDSDTQGATGFALFSVAQTGSVISFKLPLVSGSYKGTLNDSKNEIAGEWSQGGKSTPLKLTKRSQK